VYSKFCENHNKSKVVKDLNKTQKKEEKNMKKGIDFIGVGVGTIVFNEEGKVLLAQRGLKARNEIGKWEFPGGGVKFRETCENAITRETKEEFDIEIKIIESLDFFDDHISEEKQHWVFPAYISKLAGGVAKINEPDKCQDFKWVKLSEICLEDVSNDTRLICQKFIEKYGEDKVF